MTPPRFLVVGGPPLASVACERGGRPSRRSTPGWAAVTQRRLLPLVGRGAGGTAHITRALGPLEHRLDSYPARALQRQPGRLGLIARRAEPVLAVRVLEVQEHPDRGVFPDQPARLHQDALPRREVAEERVARGVQQQQAVAAGRRELVNGPPQRVVPFLVVAVLGGEPDVGVLPAVVDVPGGDEEAVLDHVDGPARGQRYGDGLPRLVG